MLKSRHHHRRTPVAVLRPSGCAIFTFLRQGVLDVRSPHIPTRRLLSISHSSRTGAHHPHPGLSRISSPFGRSHRQRERKRFPFGRIRSSTLGRARTI